MVRCILLLLLLAISATLASSAVMGQVRMTYTGSLDCAQGCNFVAAGWPLPYVIDHPGISVVGSVSLIGGLIGEDIIDRRRMAATFAFWLVFSAVVLWAVERMRRARATSRARSL